MSVCVAVNRCCLIFCGSICLMYVVYDVVFVVCLLLCFLIAYLDCLIQCEFVAVYELSVCVYVMRWLCRALLLVCFMCVCLFMLCVVLLLLLWSVVVVFVHDVLFVIIAALLVCVC